MCTYEVNLVGLINEYTDPKDTEQTTLKQSKGVREEVAKEEKLTFTEGSV